MSDNDSLFGAIIYRAIGEPEYWQKNSVEGLVKLLTEEYNMDGPNSLAQIRLGKELVGKLSEKQSLVSAVMSILDGARYGLLIVDNEFQAIYHNDKIEENLSDLLSKNQPHTLIKPLIDLVEKSVESGKSTNSSELIRLDYQCESGVNVYLRSVMRENSNFSKPKYLHHIMVAGAGDNQHRIYEQISQNYGLSNREASIVQAAVKALAGGGSNKEIAEDLFISPNTVKTHLKSIYAKTSVNSLAGLVSLYLQHEVQQLSSYFGGKDVTVEALSEHSGDKAAHLPEGKMLCYREYGDKNGRPLIVLHNLYSSRHNLPPNGDVVAKKLGRRVIIVDRPGFGKSPGGDDYPQKWNLHLKQFTDYLNLDKFDLCGNGLSVRYALEFSHQYPELIGQLILTAPLVHFSSEDKQYFGDWYSAVTQLYERSSESATEIYKLWHSSAFLRLEQHVEKNLETTISSLEKGLIDNAAFIAVIKRNYKESAAQGGRGSAADFRYCFSKMKLDIAEITVPTKIWIGDEDGLISVQGVREMFASIPNKTIIERSGYGEHIYYTLFDKIIA